MGSQPNDVPIVPNTVAQVELALGKFVQLLKASHPFNPAF